MATFGASNTTTITFSSATFFISTIQPAPARLHIHSTLGPTPLEIDGTGIVNNSLNRLTLSNSGPGGTFFRRNASTAGDTIINNTSTGFTEFAGTSTAGTALIVLNSTGAATTFFKVETSTAGSRDDHHSIRARSRSLTMRARWMNRDDATVITNSGGTTLFQNTASAPAGRNSSPTLAASSIFPPVFHRNDGWLDRGGGETTFSGSKSSHRRLERISQHRRQRSSPSRMEGLAAGRAARLSRKVGTGTLDPFRQ